MSEVRLRPARAGEEATLSELCLKSKGHWGYDAEFVAACEPYLKVTAEDVAAGHTTVAETSTGAVLGVCQIAPGNPHGSLDLLFITPDAIGQGIGRRLFEHAKGQLRAAGETVMTILSDPYAETTYLHMGAKRVEMRASDVFKDRELPWLEVAL
jgi:GNAT superfamily N-acetyltransferase